MAHCRGLPVIDLRRVCAEQRACFANPTEPGALGDRRIVEAIARQVGA